MPSPILSHRCGTVSLDVFELSGPTEDIEYNLMPQDSSHDFSSPSPDVVSSPSAVIPDLIFIVPYRDRYEQYVFFDDHMRTRVLADMDPSTYLILYAHQCDDRPFNRGGMKNIGFLAAKKMFPNDYKNITFVFQDVDTMPYRKNFLNYKTVPGVVKHFYGYKFALGGIVSITGGDFEKVNGFIMPFSWSMEDNSLQIRVLAAGIVIDRSNFHPIMSKNILQQKDDIIKIVNRTDFLRLYNGSQEGINQITNLEYTVDETTGFVNITQFETPFIHDPSTNKVHHILSGTKVWKPHELPNRLRQRGHPRFQMFK